MYIIIVINKNISAKFLNFAVGSNIVEVHN